MIYIWRIRNDYPDSLIGTYDRKRGPDRFLYKQGKRLEMNLDAPPRFEFGANTSSLRALNDLANSAMVPLVSPRVAKVLGGSCAEQVQLIPAEVVCSNGLIQDYSIVNVTKRVRGLDHAKSRYTCMPGMKAIMRFDLAIYQDDCLGNLNLARDEEYLSNLLLSERLRNELQAIEDLGIYSCESVDWS